MHTVVKGEGTAEYEGNYSIWNDSPLHILTHFLILKGSENLLVYKRVFERKPPSVSSAVFRHKKRAKRKL